MKKKTTTALAAASNCDRANESVKRDMKQRELITWNECRTLTGIRATGQSVIEMRWTIALTVNRRWKQMKGESERETKWEGWAEDGSKTEK